MSIKTRTRIGKAASLIAALPLLAQCERLAPAAGPPPRVTERLAITPQSSTIAVPITASLAPLYSALEREVPRTLWAIDKPGQTCVASSKVKVLGVKLKTPKIKCRLVGKVTRGAMTVTGNGRDLVVTMPIHAIVRARDIAGVIKQETATADARVKAIVRLDVAKDWSPQAKVDIVYDWTQEPTVEILGQTIRLTDQADSKLKGVVARLERTLPREIAALPLRRVVSGAWADAFTSLQLNRDNPPVWLRVTPQALEFGGFRVDGRQLRIDLGMQALTETFIGDRPADPAPTPLPAMRPLTRPPGTAALQIPVVADYRELEPVILRALIKRSARPFDLPGLGPVTARFDRVEAYATEGGRIAVGITLSASDQAKRLGQSQGTIWLTAVPVNAENSRKVSFTQLQVRGGTDNKGTNLLLQLANAPIFATVVAEALGQNFDNDFAKLLGKIDRAIAEKRTGNLLIRAEVQELTTGRLAVSGEGLQLPATARGTVRIAVVPR